MTTATFEQQLAQLRAEHNQLLDWPNRVDPAWTNGVFERYIHPVVTAAHTPLFWRYDLNPATNPYLMERLGVNAVFNPGAIEFDGRFVLMCRVEGADRKSFFAVVESPNGIDNFRFWNYPVEMPETGHPDTNVYDMRLVRHQDGWIYGLFCTERKDPTHNILDYGVIGDGGRVLVPAGQRTRVAPENDTDAVTTRRAE